MSNTAPLVSVVIPCYNHGKFIRETVQKTQEQSYPSMEIIVVNDGSTDQNTIEVLDALRTEITVLDKENGHLSSARNHGIQYANGDYILVLDSDDYFDNSFVSKAMDRMKKNANLGMVTSWVQYFGDDNHVAKTSPGSLVDFMVKNTFCGNFLLRKEAWKVAGGYDENMKKGMEDWNFTIAVLGAGFEVDVIEEPLFFYRKEGGSMSTYSEIHRAEIFQQIIKNHKSLFSDNMEAVFHGKEEEITRLRELNKKLASRIGHLENRLKTIEGSSLFKLSGLKGKIFGSKK